MLNVERKFDKIEIGETMESYLKFHFSAFDSFDYPLRDPVKLFSEDGSMGDRVTAQIESEAVRWLLRTHVARELIWEELNLPRQTYAQSGVIQPVIADPKKKPGDVDLLLVPHFRPEGAISIQTKRVKVEAVDTLRDKVSNRHLGNLKDLIDQANASRDLGFHLNYAVVIIQVDGIARSGVNALYRGITTRQFTRIYNLVIGSPVHRDVGVVFIEISQPTCTNVTRTGVVAVCVDKPAVPLDQSVRLTAGVRELMANCPSE